MPARVLSRRFYMRDPLIVARSLIGKRLVFAPDGERLSGFITETEAYIGIEDPACHAFNGRRGRASVMYERGGVAYVYFTYGNHFMLNFVVGSPEIPIAVLIRAAAPSEGIELMKARRKIAEIEKLASGPGNLCRAFGIDKRQNGVELFGPTLWVEQAKLRGKIKTSPRIGIGDRWAAKPWRFYLAGHPSVSGPGRWRK